MDKVIDLDWLYCPITQEIFNDPVVADDMIVYEKEAIERWFIQNDTSPVTRDQITKRLTRCIFVKDTVTKAIRSYPELKENQYVPKNYKTTKRISTKEVNDIIIAGRFSDLIEYTQFDLQKIMDQNLMSTLAQKCDVRVFKYIINNSIDIECHDSNNWRLIHFICRYSTPEMIKYIIDRGVNLEVETHSRWRPIHYICRYSTPDTIKYIIDKGVELERQCNDNWRPIHQICKYSTPEMVRYIVNKGVNLECETNIGQRPAHLIFKYHDVSLIKFITDKGAVLDCKDNDKHTPIDLISENNSVPESEKNTLVKSLLKKPVTTGPIKNKPRFIKIFYKSA